MVFTSESLSRAGVVQILSTSWAADPPHHLAFRSWLCAKISRLASVLYNIPAVKHRCCKTYRQLSVYSRKLELLNFLWTYQPHEAAAEVSKDKEPIGRRCGSQLVRNSFDFRTNWGTWDSSGLKFNCFEFHRFEVQVFFVVSSFELPLIWDSTALVVNWLGRQRIWLSIGSSFKWFGCQSIWDSSVQGIWDSSSDLRFKWCEIQMVSNWTVRFSCFEIQWVGESFALRVNWLASHSIWGPMDLKFKKWSLNLQNEASLRDFLPKPRLKLKNQAFLRDFLQKWRFEDQKRSFSARLPSKM